MLHEIVRHKLNRKLYSYSTSSYLTNTDVMKLIRSGDDVRVIDYETKKDITHDALLNIVFTGQNSEPVSLPVKTVTEIIRKGGVENFIRSRRGERVLRVN